MLTICGLLDGSEPRLDGHELLAFAGIDGLEEVALGLLLLEGVGVDDVAGLGIDTAACVIGLPLEVLVVVVPARYYDKR
jgi:hypothetical protein